MPKRKWENVGTTTIIVEGQVVKPGGFWSGNPPRQFIRQGSLRRAAPKRRTK